MGMGEEFYNAGIEEENDVSEIYMRFSEYTDEELLETAISMGESLDKQFEPFPAYSVALKLKNNNWKVSEKQREAIINVMARYIYENDLPEDCYQN